MNEDEQLKARSLWHEMRQWEIAMCEIMDQMDDAVEVFGFSDPADAAHLAELTEGREKAKANYEAYGNKTGVWGLTE